MPLLLVRLLVLAVLLRVADVVAARDASDVLAVNCHNLAPPAGELEMIAAAGLKTIRMDLNWADFEVTRGVYSFDVTDKYVSALSSHGLRWIAIFGPRNPNYDNNTNVHTKEGIAAFARWAGAFAAQYKTQLQAGDIYCEMVCLSLISSPLFSIR